MFLIDNVTPYQHVERFGSKAVDGLLDGWCLVQEKIDGANLTITRTPEHGLVICTRRTCIHSNGEPKTGFRGAVEYVLGHIGIIDFVKAYPELVLRGEWLTKHVVKYPQDKMNKFYVFDVQNRETGEYLRQEDYAPMIEAFGIEMVPVIGCYKDLTIKQIQELADMPSGLGAEKREGVVVKRYDFVNRYGETTWGKFVNETYVQKKREPKPDYAIENKFAEKIITKEFVLKTIQTIKDMRAEKGEDDDVTVRDMREVLGRTWSDALNEELLAFVKKNKVRVFDFGAAQRAVASCARDFALAYFNGI